MYDDNTTVKDALMHNIRELKEKPSEANYKLAMDTARKMETLLEAARKYKDPPLRIDRTKDGIVLEIYDTDILRNDNLIETLHKLLGWELLSAPDIHTFETAGNNGKSTKQ